MRYRLGLKRRQGSKTEPIDVVFKLYSLGVNTARDEAVYGYDRDELQKQVERFTDAYNAEVDRFRRKGAGQKVDDFVDYTYVKWSSTLKGFLARGISAEFDAEKIKPALYRPYSRQFLVFTTRR